MKIINKLLVIIPVIVLTILSVYFVLEYYNVGKYDNFILVTKDLPDNKEEVYEEKITSLKKEYNNDDVVGTIQINDTDFNTAIMQGKDKNIIKMQIDN